MKYTTNNQNEFENLATLHLSAFNKWVNQKSNLLDNVDINMKGGQKISNMICFMSSKQKIIVLMACLYLLWSGPFYEFHEFVILFIKHLLYNLMNANIVEVSLVRSINGNLAIHTHYILFISSRFIGTLVVLWIHLNL
jgi:hypothetical protein